MKMENAAFNFLMENCFQPEEICGIDLIALEQRSSREQVQRSALPEETRWQLNQLPIKKQHTWP